MKTAHVNFKRDNAMTVENIEDFVKSNGFSEFKVVLPRESASSGERPSLRKGFCFIRFATEDDLTEFVGKMDGENFMGGTLRVSKKNGDKDAYDSHSDEGDNN